MPGFTCHWVSSPLRDITRKQLRFFAEPPTLHFAPSSGFHSLSTVSSALELAGLFHPAATSRVLFRPGASLPPQPPFLIGKSIPPCRCCIVAPTHGPTFAGSLVSPRTTPLGFEASICARPRSSGPVIHLAQSRSPLRISRSSRFSLSRRRRSLSRSPSAHDVTRSVFENMSVLRLRCSESTARHRFSKLVRTSQGVDPRAVPRCGSSFDDRAGGRHRRRCTFRCFDQHAESRASPSCDGSTFSVAMLAVVAATCIFRCGSLVAAILSRLDTLTDAVARTILSRLAAFRDRSRIMSTFWAAMSALACLSHPCGWSPACGARDCASSLRGWSRRMIVSRRSRSCLPSRCLRSRSSFDARVHIRVRVLPSSVRCFRTARPSALSVRVHDQELLIVLTFSCA
jgi:hypothetical protein